MGTVDNEKYLKEVEGLCLSQSKKLKTEGKLKNQSHYKSNLKTMGLNIPSVSKIAKEGFSFDDLSQNNQFKIWQFIWLNSDFHEVRTIALSFLSKQDKEFLIKNFLKLKVWIKGIENWAHSDSYCSVISSLYEYRPNVIGPQLKTWNNSKRPWPKRVSLVSLYYYSAARDKLPKTKIVIDFLNKLLKDQDYYIQKGVGWTLRELGNVEPEIHLRYLEKNILDISPTAFSTSIEKLSKEKKEQLKKLRKSRSKKILK